MYIISTHNKSILAKSTDQTEPLPSSGDMSLPPIFFPFQKCISQLCVVLVDILSHIIHDLLTSDSYISIATTSVSISYLQTSLEWKMCTPQRFFFSYSNEYI